MANLFVMIGISGSGKSTYAEKILSELRSKGTDVVLISSDAIRGELCGGNESDQSKNKMVFEVAHQRMEEVLAAGASVVWDATNLAREDRAKPIQIARKHMAKTVAFDVRTPLTVAIARNGSRTRKVPTHIIWKQQGRYFPPTRAEFDTIMLVDKDGVREM